MHERLIAANRAAGWPDLTTADLEDIEALAEPLSELLFRGGEFSNHGNYRPYQYHWLGQALAVERINQFNDYRRKREPFGYNPFGRTLTVDPMTKFVCIPANERRAYLLDNPDDWVLYDRECACDVKLSDACTETYGAGIGIKRGEYVIVRSACDDCCKALQWVTDSTDEQVLQRTEWVNLSRLKSLRKLVKT